MNPTISDSLLRRRPAEGAGLLLFALASILFCRDAAAQDAAAPAANAVATIHGVVLSTTDHKPIAGAQVMLMVAKRSEQTDDKGQFSFAGVAFGMDVVTAKKPGYLCSLMRSGEQPKCAVPTEIGSSDIEVKLTMTPQAVVTGHVADQTGAPIVGLQLDLMTRIVEDGLYAWQFLGATAAKTDKDGAFRIANLEPGNYLLRTSSMADPNHERDEGYAAAYYPGPPDPRDPKLLVVQAGQELNVDLKLSLEKFQPVSATYAWQNAGSSGSVGWDFGSVVGHDDLHANVDTQRHQFNLFAPAGDYKLQFTIYAPRDSATKELVPWSDGSNAPRMGTAEFAVRDQPVAISEIPSQQAITIPLRVRTEFTQQEKRKAVAGPENPNASPIVDFKLVGEELRFNNQIVWRFDNAQSDLAFKDVWPGRYVVRADGNQGTYVAAITCGGVNLLREPLVVGPGVPSCAIEAVVRDDPASLAVTVSPQALARMTEGGVTVTDLALIPLDNPEALPFSAGLWRESLPKLVEIPPGTYLAFLFDGRGIAWRDPETLKRLMSLGTVIKVAAADRQAVQLDWPPQLNDQTNNGATVVSLGRVLP